MSILCKIGLHKWGKVKSTKTTVMIIMNDIIRAESKTLLPINNEEIMCRKFGLNRNTLWVGYDIYDLVCTRCGSCEYNIDKKRHELLERRNQIVRKEMNDRNKDRIIENMYKGCKSGS